MKYAAICSYGSAHVNIGDYLFFLSVFNLYEKMGISYEEVYKLNVEDVFTYNGEELILPFNHALTQFVKNGKIAISPKIKPIFLAAVLPSVTNFSDINLFFQNEYNINYLLKHSPIGCRDKATYDILKNFKIPAYINGCLTAAFPKIDNLSGKKIILADAPLDLLPFIPDKILNEKPLITTQQYGLQEEVFNDFDKTFDFVKEKYKFYIDNAKLIITSRLHVALPCAAFGIPVILAKDVIDSRFSFVEEYFPIYDKSNYKNINWNPLPLNLEEQKNKLIELNVNRIADKPFREDISNFLTDCFLKSCDNKSFINPHTATNKNNFRVKNHIEAFWSIDKPENYALWGVTDKTALFWKTTVEDICPNAKLTAIFDRYSCEKLCELTKLPPEKISDFPDVKIIVCAVSAVNDALALFKQYKISKDRYCIAVDQFISAEDIKPLGEK